VFSREILTFIRDLDTREIHGYKPEFGYRVYTEKAIESISEPAAPERRSNTHRPAPPESSEPAALPARTAPRKTAPAVTGSPRKRRSPMSE
jgi:arginine decarboxylase